MSEERLTDSLQENLLTLIAVDDENCKLVRSMVPVELFSSFLYRDIVSQCYQYIDEFGKAPKDHLPDLLESQLRKDDDKAKLFKSTLNSIANLAENLNSKFVMNRMNDFIREQQVKVSIVLASEALQKHDLISAERLILEGFKKRHAAFEPALTVLEGFDQWQRQDLDKDRINLGIEELDRKGAGPTRGEWALFIAPPKAGKTWWLIHIAKRAALQRLNVLAITLEVSALVYAQRLVQSFLTVSKRQGQILIPEFRFDHDRKLADIVKSDLGERLSLDQAADLKRIRRKLVKINPILDHIRIKQFPTGQLTCNQLNAYLESIGNTGFQPDVVIIDYPDLMKINPNNLRGELQALGKDIRGIMVERNIIGAGASQVNRASTGKKVIEATGVAEDFSKIAIADSVISYNQTMAERRASVARLFVAAARTDEDKYQTVVAQCYAVGQFAMASVHPGMQYHSLIRTRYAEEEMEEEGTEGEDEA